MTRPIIINEDKEERNDREENDDSTLKDEGKMLFQVSEAGNTFLEAIIGKRLEAVTHRKWVQK